ncbi:hypothetical protein [Umezawaea sp. Da 62-37]|uniref:hypothetical protein n=1 Tax=Umezawaea sp. Da 62-37 TaxID=3075927 RepID=UPI0028F740BE|nr:hypothetical protein [Umezawaea sp. Da 62-37]WNV90450.1 hypothetical protein RM788_19845 [Umezawaea sp. Da 62-37]
MTSTARSTVVLAALGIAVLASGPVHARSDDARPLADVLSTSGMDLSSLAERNGVTGDQLRLMALGGHYEVDRMDGIRSVEPLVAATDSTSETPVPDGVDVFALHSRPESSRTLYLDFDGHTAQGTRWRGGARVVAPPYDADGHPSTFGAAERGAIRDAFLAVAENFRPFDVDVTTQAPDEDRITRSGIGDAEFGTRVVITPVDVTGCDCGGQSYVGEFDNHVDHAVHQPSWVYTGAGSTDGKLLAEVVSHEAGHTLGLLHDGQGGGAEYYYGHQNWAPTMGAAQYQPVTQWSRGEYRNPSNRQDDMAVMAREGVPLLADDFVGVGEVEGVVRGVISSDSDVDEFLVRHGGGELVVTVVPAPFSPNLDVRLTVVGEGGVVIGSVDPPLVRRSAVVAGGMDARFSGEVGEGEYVVRVEGVGFGDVGVNGYSGYGSVGEYTLSVG